MANEIRAPLILDDTQAVAPLRRVGEAAKKAGADGAKAQTEFTAKTAAATAMAVKLAREIARINAKAAFNEAAKASEALRQAQERLAATTSRTASVIQSASLAMAGLNQGMELGKKIYAMAQGLYEFAAAGAEVAGVESQFGSFENRLDGVKVRIQSTTAAVVQGSGVLDAIAQVSEDATESVGGLSGEFSVLTVLVDAWKLSFYPAIGPMMAVTRGIKEMATGLGLLDEEATLSIRVFQDMAAEWEAAIDKANRLRDAITGDQIADAINSGFGGISQAQIVDFTNELRILDAETLHSSLTTTDLAQQILDVAGSAQAAEQMIGRMGKALEASGGTTAAELKRIHELAKEVNYLANSAEQVGRVEKQRTGEARKKAPRGTSKPKAAPGQWGDTPSAMGQFGGMLGGIGGALGGSVAAVDAAQGERATPDFSRMFGLDNLAEAAKSATAPLVDGFGAALDVASRLNDATATLAESVRTTLTDAFVNSFTAILDSSGSFREQMFGAMGGMLSDLATAFGAWAVTEGALLSGNPFAAAVSVGLMKLAASKISASASARARAAVARPPTRRAVT